MKLIAGVVGGGGEGFGVGGGGIESEEFRCVVAEVGLRGLRGEAGGGGFAFAGDDLAAASSAFQPARSGTWACLPAA